MWAILARIKPKTPSDCDKSQIPRFFPIPTIALFATATQFRQFTFCHKRNLQCIRTIRQSLGVLGALAGTVPVKISRSFSEGVDNNTAVTGGQPLNVIWHLE